MRAAFARHGAGGGRHCGLASEGKGAFGLPAATGLTAGSTEYNSAVADAPFGSSGRAVPLFVKSELMLSYSWGGARCTATPMTTTGTAPRREI